MKRWVLVIILFLILLGLFFVLRGTGKEDDFGEGKITENQQKIAVQAKELYLEKKQEGMQFSSQCLGVVGDDIRYAVDIVHVPRSEEDNKPENQCEEYRKGEVKHFIELDKEGNVVRIV